MFVCLDEEEGEKKKRVDRYRIVQKDIKKRAKRQIE